MPNQRIPHPKKTPGFVNHTFACQIKRSLHQKKHQDLVTTISDAKAKNPPHKKHQDLLTTFWDAKSKDPPTKKKETDLLTTLWHAKSGMPDQKIPQTQKTPGFVNHTLGCQTKGSPTRKKQKKHLDLLTTLWHAKSKGPPTNKNTRIC